MGWHGMIKQDFQSGAGSPDCQQHQHLANNSLCHTSCPLLVGHIAAATCPHGDQSAMIVYSIKWHNEAVFSQPPLLLLSSTGF